MVYSFMSILLERRGQGKGCQGHGKKCQAIPEGVWRPSPRIEGLYVGSQELGRGKVSGTGRGKVSGTESWNRFPTPLSTPKFLARGNRMNPIISLPVKD